jgi:hypothetical protein
MPQSVLCYTVLRTYRILRLVNKTYGYIKDIIWGSFQQTFSVDTQIFVTEKQCFLIASSVVNKFRVSGHFHHHYYRLYSPRWALASSSKFCQRFLSWAAVNQFLQPSFLVSFSTPSVHLDFCRPLSRWSSGFIHNIFLGNSFRSIRAALPAHLNLLDLITLAMFGSGSPWSLIYVGSKYGTFFNLSICLPKFWFWLLDMWKIYVHFNYPVSDFYKNCKFARTAVQLGNIANTSGFVYIKGDLITHKVMKIIQIKYFVIYVNEQRLSYLLCIFTKSYFITIISLFILLFTSTTREVFKKIYGIVQCPLYTGKQ